MLKFKTLLIISLFTVALLGVGFTVWQGQNRTQEVASSQKGLGSLTQSTQANGDVTKLDYTDLQLNERDDIYQVKTQKKIQKKIDNLLNSKDYSFNHPLVLSNPFLTNTTGLNIYFDTKKASKVDVTITTKGFKSYHAKLYNSNGTYSKTHAYQILGSIAGHKNVITLTATAKDGTTQTKTLTYTAPKLQSTTQLSFNKKTSSSKSALSKGLYVVIGDQSSKKRSTYYADNSGVIRAEIPLIGYNSMRLLKAANGEIRLLVSSQKIVTLNRLGKMTSLIDISDSDYLLHHDMVVDKQGNLLALATSKSAEKKSKLVEDRIVRINVQDGTIKEIANFATLWPELYQKATSKAKLTDNPGSWDPVHLNTIQFTGDDSLIVSSRETSTIVKLTNISTHAKIAYTIGDSSIWKGLGTLGSTLLKKSGDFLSQSGQHTVTYETSDKLPKGQYYLYMFNNNSRLMESRPSYSWKAFGADTTVKYDSKHSQYYKYLVDESKGTYKLVKSTNVPSSAFVGSSQEYSKRLIVNSGQKGQFGEYTTDGKLIASFTTRSSTKFIYRVFKHDFQGIYFW